MATLIDALLVTLGLDASKFKSEHKASQEAMKKTGEEAKKQNAEIHAGISRVAEGYRAARNEILSMLGISLSAGGMRQFAEMITKSDAATGRLALNLGMAAQRLSSWTGASKRYGATADDMASSFRTLNDMVQRIRKDGWDERLLPLQRAGLDSSRFLSTAIDNEQRMAMLASLFSSLSAQDAQYFGQLAGFSESTINALREMGPALESILQKQKELNAASERDVELAKERIKLWADATDAVEGYGRKALNALHQAGEGMGGWLWDLFNQDPMRVINGNTGPRGGSGAVGGIGAVSWLGALWNKSTRAGGGPAGENYSHEGRGKGMNSAGLLSSLERQYGLPAGLLDAVWTQESARGKHMLSPAGAKGHFGFMPRTATEYGIAGQENDLGASADAAARKFRDLLKRYGGNLNTALAAYNAGDKRVLSGGPLPAETIRYIQQISERMGRRDAAAGVQIDQVNVYSRAADGDGLARDFVHSTHRELSMAAQAESGVN